MSDHDTESTLPLTEKCTDPNDRATQAEMEANADALRTIQLAAQRQQEPDANGVYAVTDCEDCGDEINPRRLAVAIKNRLCVICCAAQEKRRYLK